MTLAVVADFSVGRFRRRKLLGVSPPPMESPPSSQRLADIDVAISAGGEDRVTDTVERVTGRPARNFKVFASKEIH